MTTKEEKKQKIQFALNFERTLLLAKARAYSNTSLERPLTNDEFNEYKSVMGRLDLIN